MQGAWGFSTGLRPTKTPVEKCEIILGRQDDVPAFSDIARGQAQNPKHYSFISSRLPQSVFDASEPSSVFSPRSCRRLYFRLFGLFCRLYFRLFGLFRRLCRRCIWNILLKIVDVETIQDQICMFQDSVPAGSYNDPFLSSVWTIQIKERISTTNSPWFRSSPPFACWYSAGGIPKCWVRLPSGFWMKK